MDAVFRPVEAKLFQFCKQGRLEQLEEILTMSNVNLTDSSPFGWNRSLLHVACQNNQLAVAQLLLKYGANPNLRDSRKQTPLHYACLNNNMPLIQLLIENGASMNIVDDRGVPPLLYALDDGNMSVVRTFVQKSINNILYKKEQEALALSLPKVPDKKKKSPRTPGKQAKQAQPNPGSPQMPLPAVSQPQTPSQAAPPAQARALSRTAPPSRQKPQQGAASARGKP
eukprot:TRINITY_DN22284_c0_g1_i1.p1 TRINITY_DN22284_c0_g1~~TRINITY_DN22284_c0_g1_i1.p1  ORF type:complete len:239 (+),score=55.12 TRINITY_DN22284_c0_g1_i1:40-717(+)